MPVKNHGISGYSQGRGEQHIHSRQELAERITHQLKSRVSTSGSHKGSSTTYDHASAPPPSIPPLTPNTAVPSPPPFNSCGSNEGSFELSQFAGTLFEQTYRQRSSHASTLERSRKESARPKHVPEDLGQNTRPADPASDPNLQSHIADLSNLFSMIEDETENEVETEMRRDLGFTPVTDLEMTECMEIEPEMLREIGFMPVTNSLMTEFLESVIPFPGVAFIVRACPGVKKKKWPGHGIRSVFSEGQELKPKILKSLVRIVTRTFKYWRQAQLSRSQREDPALANVNGSRTIPEGEHCVAYLPTICHRLIVEWKTRAGKNKDWRVSPIRNLLRKDNMRGRESCERGNVPSTAANWLGRNMPQASFFTATRLHETPRVMLRSYGQYPSKSDSKVPLYSRRGTKRRLKYDCDKKKPRYFDLDRKRKRERASDTKDLISEGKSFLRVVGHTSFAAVDTILETDKFSPSCPPSDSALPMKLPSKRVMFPEPSKCPAGVLSIPYESRIGAIVGTHFVLRGIISTKLCYDVYATTDVYTDMVYTAKVYSIRGTKGNERKYRLTSLKRNASKDSCIASIDQGGRKWLFFSGGIEHFVETGSTDDASAWYGEEQYQHHFPLLSPRFTTCNIAYTPPRKTYASCVPEVASESKDRIARNETSCVQEVALLSDHCVTQRKERARDRQRNKRKQKRAAKATARKATDDEFALPEKTSTSVKESRAASISYVGDKLQTLSFAELFDRAEFGPFVGLLDEDIGERLYGKSDGRGWEHLIDGLAETFERRRQKVFAECQTLARIVVEIGQEMKQIDLQMVQYLETIRGVEEVKRTIDFSTIMGTNLRDRERRMREMGDLANKAWEHMVKERESIDDQCKNIRIAVVAAELSLLMR